MSVGPDGHRMFARQAAAASYINGATAN